MRPTTEDVRRVATALPRTEEALVRDRIKFRVRRIVYVALSRDETLMGFAFPREERADLVAAEPDKFLLPGESDMRFNWVVARLDALDVTEMSELVVDAWRMCVPKSVAAAHAATLQHFPESLPDSDAL
ncbi:hypothetical protein SRB17_30000 [Streptomyces sp. RB17]|uniref:MmcQ/YjbR family DNA-binding protein n=1 Tax=Streptomyces sp. RB17 TaxID=2585197 RepID=UPI001294C11E|nr:MmcQ/YjbR family DNA-binding protein [Streptomyces sp. RB17]MQY35028.1 hypothetical protein [Streptomyces sp. RB17]